MAAGCWAAAACALRFPASCGQTPCRRGSWGLQFPRPRRRGRRDAGTRFPGALRGPAGCGAGWGLQAGRRRAGRGWRRGDYGSRQAAGGASALGLLGTGLCGRRGGAAADRGSRRAARAAPPGAETRPPSLCVWGSGRHSPPLCAGRAPGRLLLPPCLPFLWAGKRRRPARPFSGLCAVIA